jgi:hypothetical protein
MLDGAGYENVQMISNSKIALAALEQWMPIKLLVSDIVVPGGLDGIPLAKLAQLLQPVSFSSPDTPWACRAGHGVADIAKAGLLHDAYCGREPRVGIPHRFADNEAD